MQRRSEEVALDRSLLAARNRFFPGWWMYEQLDNQPALPFYRVTCRSPLECDLVRRARPSFVKVEIVEIGPPDKILLDQLMRSSEEKIGSVLSDRLALDLLEFFQDVRQVGLRGLAKEMTGPRHWMALAKLLRADLVIEFGASLSITSLGREQVKEWQRVSKTQA